ncbi:MAG: hypothetical protein ACRCUY_00315 [Thermoguttaceae bacterium]
MPFQGDLPNKPANLRRGVRQTNPPTYVGGSPNKPTKRGSPNIDANFVFPKNLKPRTVLLELIFETTS